MEIRVANTVGDKGVRFTNQDGSFVEYVFDKSIEVTEQNAMDLITQEKFKGKAEGYPCVR